MAFPVKIDRCKIAFAYTAEPKLHPGRKACEPAMTSDATRPTGVLRRVCEGEADMTRHLHLQPHHTTPHDSICSHAVQGEAGPTCWPHQYYSSHNKTRTSSSISTFVSISRLIGGGPCPTSSTLSLSLADDSRIVVP